ncbi:MAG TPA: hypothetical protein PKL83_06670 [bacterium]|nr:hypothetical protein [bacterium]
MFLLNTLIPSPTQAEEAKVQMSAEIVAPTNLFVPVRFSGWTIPFGKAVLYDMIEDRIYIQEEQGNEGTFLMEFVLDRKADEMEQFELFVTYKGLESRHVPYTVQPSTYQPESTADIVLPPVLDINREEVKSTEEIIVFGYGCPDCNMVFTFTNQSGEITTYSSLTDEYGFAEVKLPSGLPASEYVVTATVTYESRTSISSHELHLKVSEGLEGLYGYLPGISLIPAAMEFLSTPFGILSAFLLGLLLVSLIYQTIKNLRELIIGLKLFLLHLFHLNILQYFPPLGKKNHSEKQFIIRNLDTQAEIIVDTEGHNKKSLTLQPGDYRCLWHEEHKQETICDLHVALATLPATEPTAIAPMVSQSSTELPSVTESLPEEQPVEQTIEASAPTVPDKHMNHSPVRQLNEKRLSRRHFRLKRQIILPTWLHTEK